MAMVQGGKTRHYRRDRPVSPESGLCPANGWCSVVRGVFELIHVDHDPPGGVNQQKTPPWRGFPVCAPGTGALLEVQVLP